MRLTRPEIAVVAVVVVLGLCLSIPFIVQQRAAARSLMCRDRLRRLADAAAKYEAAEGRLPGYSDHIGKYSQMTWTAILLPHLTTSDPAGEQHILDVYKRVPFGNEGQADPSYLPELVCPARHVRSFSYVANCGMPDVRDAKSPLPLDWQANGVFFDRSQPMSKQITTSLDWISQHDGMKVTLLFSENVDARDWVAPYESTIGFVWAAYLRNGEPTSLPDVLWPINAERGRGGLDGAGDGSFKFARPSSEHLGGVNVAMCSGDTQLLSEKIDYLVYQRLMTPDGTGVKKPGKDEFLPAPWRTPPPK